MVDLWFLMALFGIVGFVANEAAYAKGRISTNRRLMAFHVIQISCVLLLLVAVIAIVCQFLSRS